MWDREMATERETHIPESCPKEAFHKHLPAGWLNLRTLQANSNVSKMSRASSRDLRKRHRYVVVILQSICRRLTFTLDFQQFDNGANAVPLQVRESIPGELHGGSDPLQFFSTLFPDET
ncbi:hypothetical protein TWF173_004420 [Orbilia oligospora]|nr:hypothetical protein TWF173_004420 [Orbilia oligospora]